MPVLTLAEMSATRQRRTLTWAQLSKSTGLDWEHLKHLESVDARRPSEPWFDEAIIIARALCTAGIYPLITNGPGHLVDLGTPLPGAVDIDLFRSGMRIRLSVACRVARAFGLSDPIELVQPRAEMVAELWRIVATGERSTAPGNCPWCNEAIVGDAGHLPTCLPNNMWGRRGREIAPHIKLSVPPERRGVGRGAAFKVWGIKAIRERLGLSQAEMAAKCGYKAPNHYARVERGEVTMNMDRASSVAVVLGVEVNDLIVRPLNNPAPTHDTIEPTS